MATATAFKLPGLARSRKSKGFSRGQLASRAKLSGCTVYYIEVSQARVLPRTAQKLATALGVSITTLRTK